MLLWLTRDSISPLSIGGREWRRDGADGTGEDVAHRVREREEDEDDCSSLSSCSLDLLRLGEDLKDARTLCKDIINQIMIR